MLTLLLSLLASQQVSGSVLLSKNKPTSQSSNYGGTQGLSSRAVDGIYVTRWGDLAGGACTHTQSTINNWWSVDLESDYTVTAVVIYNRADCCQDRIGGAKVYVGQVFCGEVVYSGANRIVVNCRPGIVGQTVRIVQDYQYLTLCEVEVYGDRTTGQPLVNVALGKRTIISSSTGYGGVPDRAVDGRVSGNWGEETCTHSADRGFNSWMVDLGEKFLIDSVVIHNRKDCCSDRLNGAQVLIDFAPCGTVSTVAGKLVYPLSCYMRGQYVTITKTGDYLTLCEVEVLALPNVEPVCSACASSSSSVDVTFSIEAPSTKSGWAWDVLLVSVFDMATDQRLAVTEPFDSGSVYYANPSRYGGYHVRNAFNPNTGGLWGGRKGGDHDTFYLGGKFTCEQGTQLSLELEQRGVDSTHAVSSEHAVYVVKRNAPGGWYWMGKLEFVSGDQKKMRVQFCCE